MGIKVTRKVQELPFFWFKTKVTFVSLLSLDEACERLQKTLPRFTVSPDVGALLRLSRQYSGRLKENSFRLSGPLGQNAGRMLDVQGTIEHDRQGSRIDVTISPAGAFFVAFLCFILGIVAAGICAFLDQSFSPLAPSLLIPLWGLGTVGYAVAMAGSRLQLKYLLNYLQTLFKGKIEA